MASYDGGAIGYYPSGAVVTGEVINCIFMRNQTSSTKAGGAINAENGSPLEIRQCRFIHNQGGYLGGAVSSAGQPGTTISDCYFEGNNANGYHNGGAIYFSNNGGGIYRSIFITNSASGSSGVGGAICLRNYTTTTGLVANSIFRGNVGRKGGAIGVMDANARLVNLTIVTNTALDKKTGDGIYHSNAAYDCLIENSILWDNGDADILPSAGVTCTYSCVKGGFEGVGNVDRDPLFADDTYLHLQSRQGHYADGYFAGGYWTNAPAQSPLIDGGNPLSDYSAEPWPHGGRINMGAYGNTPVASLSPSPGTLLLVR